MLIAAPGAMGGEVLLQPAIKASAADARATRNLAALGRRRRRPVAQTWGLSSNGTENRHKLKIPKGRPVTRILPLFDRKR